MDNAFLDLAAVAEQGVPAALATIVNGRGPTYRKPGASAVVTAERRVIGAISGGCLELDVLEIAEEVCNGGAPRLLSYDTGSEEDLAWGTASGCGGQVIILVARVTPPVLTLVTSQLHAGTPVAVATVISGPHLGRRLAICTSGKTAGDLGTPGANAAAAAVAQKQWSEGSLHPVWFDDADQSQILVQPISPPPELLVAGAGDDARPVVELAQKVGFRVTVADHRPAWLTAERFPGASRLLVDEENMETVSLPAGGSAVIMTHHFYKDQAWLKLLLSGAAGYVGLLGARQRSRQLVELVLAENPQLKAAVDQKLQAPVGLFDGADGPQEIALSIVSELVKRQHSLRAQ